MLRDGEPVDGFAKPRARRVMDPYVAADVAGALGAFAGQNLGFDDFRSLGKVAAGGTGPGDRMKSAWFIGHANEMTTAVTMFRTEPGNPQLLPMQGVGGPKSERGTVFPPRIWSAYAKATLSGPE
ncbi:hypothetical protein [Streptomyces sp. 8N616]|uniref:hypothetical protein n=1 Tax=Streptomyces sp. 8N616 TaxID=3457414 RepID=UPI003FD04D5F